MTPESYERVLSVIEATPATPEDNVKECGVCGFRWDDTISTEFTPAPGARCPNEYNHDACKDDDSPGLWGYFFIIRSSAREVNNNADHRAILG